MKKMIVQTGMTLLALVFALTAQGTVRYTSPTGTDAEGLTIDHPGALRAMVDSLQAGDTLLLADGQYDQTKTLVINKRATPDKWVTIRAAEGARPVFDFRQQPNGTNGMKVTGQYIRIENITIRYAGKKGIWLENASYCHIEGLDVYGCCDSGIQLRKGGHNMVVNCDSHDNFDYQDEGGNADGFADKQGGDAFPGNTYIGCRAWHNSDDGWDSFQRQTKDNPTVYLFCATYNNGPAEFDLSAHPRAVGVDRELPCMAGKDLSHFPNGGNPNGFKLGGQGKENKASGNFTRHNTELKNCIAVGHRRKGFDQNNNAGEMTVSHCLAVGNDINYGFGNPYPCTLHITHCISLNPTSGEHLTTAPEGTVVQADNSWNDTGEGSDAGGDARAPHGDAPHVADAGGDARAPLEGTELVQAIMADRQADGSLPKVLLTIMENL